MTDRQMLELIIDAGEKMRWAQVMYYDSPENVTDREYKELVQLQQDFDTAIYNIKQIIKQ